MKLISCKIFKNYNDNALSTHIIVLDDKKGIVLNSGMWTEGVCVHDWSFNFSAFPKKHSVKNRTKSDDGEQMKKKGSVHNRGNCGNGSGDQVHVGILDNDE